MYLRLSDIENDFLVIDRDKNGERVYFPVEGDLAPLVERRAEASEFPASYLFPGPHGGNAQSSIRRWLPRIVRAAGLCWGKYMTGPDGKVSRDEDGNKILSPHGITFHTFRHSMANYNNKFPNDTFQYFILEKIDEVT